MIHKPKGFTLIELLVVISVIGILAAFAIASLSGAQSRGRDAQRKNDLDAMKKTLYMYKNDSGGFCLGGPTGSNCGPYWSASFSNQDFGADGDNANSLKKQLTPNYIKFIPQDPKFQTNADDYYLHAFQDTFILMAKLENTNDPALSNLNCSPWAPRNYCITQD